MSDYKLRLDEEELQILMRLVKSSKKKHPLSDSERNKRVGLIQRLEKKYFE